MIGSLAIGRRASAGALLPARAHLRALLGCKALEIGSTLLGRHCADVRHSPRSWSGLRCAWLGPWLTGRRRRRLGCRLRRRRGRRGRGRIALRLIAAAIAILAAALALALVLDLAGGKAG